MGNLLYLAGRRSNILYRSSDVSASPGTDTTFNTTALYDGNPGNVFRFSSAAANCYIVVDTNIVANSGFQNSTSLTGWTDASSGSGTVGTNTAAPIFGTRSASLSAGTSGVATLRQDVIMSPGENFVAFVAVYGGTTNHVKVSIRNLQSNHYLTTSASWSTALAFYIKQSSGSTNATNYQQATMESYAVCGYNREATLRIDSISTTPTTGKGNAVLIDGFQLRPEVNFVSLHGHNINPNIGVSVQFDSANTFDSSPVTAHTYTYRQPAMYAKLTSSGNYVTNDRWVRVLFSGTPTDPIEIGELWMGKYQTLTDNPKYGYDVIYTPPYAESASVSGRPYRSFTAYYPAESLGLSFFAMTTTVSSALRVPELEEMLTRSSWGTEPVVMVPYDVEPRVYLGMISPELNATRPLKTLYDYTKITLQGLPFVKRIN